MAANVLHKNATVLRPLTQTISQGAKLLSEAFMASAFHASDVFVRVMRRWRKPELECTEDTAHC